MIDNLCTAIAVDTAAAAIPAATAIAIVTVTAIVVMFTAIMTGRLVVGDIGRKSIILHIVVGSSTIQTLPLQGIIAFRGSSILQILQYRGSHIDFVMMLLQIRGIGEIRIGQRIRRYGHLLTMMYMFVVRLGILRPSAHVRWRLQVISIG